MKHLIRRSYVDGSEMVKHQYYVHVAADLVTVNHGWYAYIEYGDASKQLHRKPIMGFVTYVDPDVTNTIESLTTSPVGFDGKEIDDAVAYTTPDNRMLDIYFVDMGAFDGTIYNKPGPSDPISDKPWKTSFSVDQSHALISGDIRYSNISPL